MFLRDKTSGINYPLPTQIQHMSDNTNIADVTAISLYQAAVDIVEQVRRANEKRLAEARSLAAIVRLADEVMADRIIAVVEAANGRDLTTAEQQAQEIVGAARSGIANAVRKYADLLVEQQRMVNDSRMPKARQLLDLVRVADPAAADRLMARIEESNNAALHDAEEQAQRVLEMARSRLLGKTEQLPEQPAPVPITTLEAPPEQFDARSTDNLPKPSLEAPNPNGSEG